MNNNYETIDGGTETPADQVFANLSSEIKAKVTPLPGFACRDSLDFEVQKPWKQLMSNSGVLFGREWIDDSYYENKGIFNSNYKQEDKQYTFNTDVLQGDFEVYGMSDLVGDLTGYHLRCVSVSTVDPKAFRFVYKGHTIIISRVYDNNGKPFNSTWCDAWLPGTIRIDRNGKPYSSVFEPIGYTELSKGSKWVEVMTNLIRQYKQLQRQSHLMNVTTGTVVDDAHTELEASLLEHGLYDLTDTYHEIDSEKSGRDLRRAERKVITSKGRNREKNLVNMDLDDQITLADLMQEPPA